MKTTLDFLNEVVRRHPDEINSDAQLARFLGVKRQAVLNYKRGQNMSVLIAIRVAKILQINPMATVAATLHAQSQNDEEREFWRELYEENNH